MNKTKLLLWAIERTSRSAEHRARRLRKLSNLIASETEDQIASNRKIPQRPGLSTVSVSADLPGTDDRHRTAVVMQGPVISRDDLTFKTLQLYRQSMPHAVLILSTWNDLPVENRKRIEQLGVRVVESVLPNHRGPQNVNLQIASTSRGIQEAHAMECRYVLKTRTDTWINQCDADQFCRNLIDRFPLTVPHGAGDNRQTARIVTLDFATRLYIPYHPSDIMMFGRTEDLLRYWTPDLFGPEWQYTYDDNFGHLAGQPLPETMMCEKFLRSQGVEPKGTIADWWNTLAERFIVVDRPMIDHRWLKEFTNSEEPPERVRDRSNMAVCHFTQWMQMHCGRAEPMAGLATLASQSLYAPLLGENDKPHAA
ncbi:WavE lipopolysaccharide synthesis family protein [Rhodopirellula sp. JC639]|uniref:WavE lipopolysaccharide synthesis family protein n=1 Tax=Stieleria mannarensis TaxID=2755585 RepID=UPI00160069F7|nr:WavE lipopolysaccharide synthesis family protein [Rhodopirellula sp. JC639]